MDLGYEIGAERASMGRGSARLDEEQYIPMVLPNESFKRSINAGTAGGGPFGVQSPIKESKMSLHCEQML